MKRPLCPVILISALALLAAGPAGAQLSDNLSILDPINAEGYLKPMQRGYGQAMNANLFRTGYIPVDEFGGSLDFIAMKTFYQDKDRTYVGRTGEGFDGPANAVANTVVGSGDATVVEGNNNTAYVLPGGFDMSGASLAVPQLAINIMTGTELSVRWISLSLSDAEVGEIRYVGLGVRHNISQYLREDLVHLALSGWYQTLDADKDLVELRTWQLALHGSLDARYVSLIGGLAFENYDMKTSYTFEGGENGAPVEVELASETAFRFTGGITGHIAFVRANLTAEYVERWDLAASLGFFF
jgi:hypothetical protein